MKLCDKQFCTGCGACRNRCPKSAIKWVQNAEGFSFPEIDTIRCVNCGLCAKACPVLMPPEKNPNQDTVLAAWAKDKSIRQSSSSGGVFSVLAAEMLRRGGLVNGVAFDRDFNARHLLVDSMVDQPRLRGSKYVQSDTGDVYCRIEQKLKSGIPILFTGTPCQVAGLRSFLGREYPFLVTCDIVCHGVPSPEFFKRSVEDQYGWNSSQVADFRFRATKGWGMAPALISPDGNVKEKFFKDDYYFLSFLKGLNYRESCYSCPYASLSRVSDITIGDFWGLPFKFKFVHDMLHDGCSLVICNTDKGSAYWQACQSATERTAFPVSACHDNTQLFKPTERPAIRDTFYRDISLTIKSLPVFQESVVGYAVRKTRQFIKQVIVGLSIAYGVLVRPTTR